MTNTAKPAAGSNAKSGATTPAAPPTGCCNITFDNGTGQQFEHITEDECRKKGEELGGAAQWIAGDCA